MIVVLKCPKTGRFLNEFGGATVNIDEALRFPNGVDAETYCRKHKLKDFDIAYHFDNSQLDFAMKVGGLDVGR
jgi:hypothetical protein